MAVCVQLDLGYAVSCYRASRKRMLVLGYNATLTTAVEAPRQPKKHFDQIQALTRVNPMAYACLAALAHNPDTQVGWLAAEEAEGAVPMHAAGGKCVLRKSWWEVAGVPALCTLFFQQIEQGCPEKLAQLVLRAERAAGLLCRWPPCSLGHAQMPLCMCECVYVCVYVCVCDAGGVVQRQPEGEAGGGVWGAQRVAGGGERHLRTAATHQGGWVVGKEGKAGVGTQEAACLPAPQAQLWTRGFPAGLSAICWFMQLPQP